MALRWELLFLRFTLTGVVLPDALSHRRSGCSPIWAEEYRNHFSRKPVFASLHYFRIADLHVSHLSSGGTVSRACSGERANQQFQDVLRATVCLSASVPALGRTRHPFAVSGLEGPSPKIEFVFSASPETIRRETRECDLLRSVGNLQDLAVCAFYSSC